MSDQNHKAACPICDRPVEPRGENRAFPFCSSRCKQEDLGKWLGGAYSVPGRPASPEELVEELTNKNHR